jgi:hypothetical protein
MADKDQIDDQSRIYSIQSSALRGKQKHEGKKFQQPHGSGRLMDLDLDASKAKAEDMDMLSSK